MSGEFLEYYDNGTFKNASLFTWANDKDSPAKKPKGIVDERQNANSTNKSSNITRGLTVRKFIATPRQRLAWALTTFLFVIFLALCVTSPRYASHQNIHSPGDLMTQFLALPTLAAIAMHILLAGCAVKPVQNTETSSSLAVNVPFKAQVVGLQWLNPLQRRDYPTEWQLLWTLGLAKPNKNDDMVRTDPRGFSALQAVSPIAHDLDGTETFKGYHHKVCARADDQFP